MRVLIVDDNRNFARFLYGALATRGYQSRTAFSIADALAAAGEEHFDLFLLDIRVPDGDGRDLAARLMAAHGATPDQIVFMTALERDAVGDLSAVSTQAVLYKPFRLNGLLQILQDRAVPR